MGKLLNWLLVTLAIVATVVALGVLMFRPGTFADMDGGEALVLTGVGWGIAMFWLIVGWGIAKLGVYLFRILWEE